MVRLWATRALHSALDWVVGRPLYLVDFHCFAIPQRRAPNPTLLMDLGSGLLQAGSWLSHHHPKPDSIPESERILLVFFASQSGCAGNMTPGRVLHYFCKTVLGANHYQIVGG